MIINHKYKFLFVHIHKTAGSSIRNSLLQHVPQSYYFGYDHSFLNTIPKLSLYKNYFKFCIVRNPWDRLVSWYYSILNLKVNNDLKNYIVNNSKTFSSFLDCTQVVYETKNRKSIIDNNNILLKNNPNLLYPKSISFNQLDYIFYQNNIGVDYIGSFENLTQSWDFICEKIQKNIPLRKDKVGNWLIDSYDKDYRLWYNEIDKNKVSNLYKKDIDYFKYEF